MPLFEFASSKVLNAKLWKERTSFFRLPSYPSVCFPLEQGDNSFDKLPAELVQEIFSHCHVDCTELPNQPVKFVAVYAQRVAITLSQVCRRWRYISFGMPHLWSGFKIQNTNLVQQFLERSGTWPLYLAIGPHNHGDVPNETFSYAVDNASRWETVEFDPVCCAVEEVAKLEGKSAPCLELLIVNGYRLPRESHPPVSKAIYSLISTASRLRHLRLEYLPVSSFLDVKLLSRLTVVDLRNIRRHTVDECIRCISMCTSATDVTFTSTESGLPPTSTQVALLPRLERLEMGLRADVGSYLQYFSFPELKKLEISHSYGPYDYNALARFCTRSNCALEKVWLSLNDRNYDDDIAGYLSLSCLHPIPHVSISAYGVSKLTHSELLMKPEISSGVKEKLAFKHHIIGWGKL